MAFVLADRVQETTTTTGTSDFTLGGAVTGFQTFLDGVGDGNVTYYAAFLPGTGEWEVGYGTLSSTATVLSRTVLDSSTGSKVSFSAGTKNVFVTYPAGKSVNLDTSGNVSALGTVASGTWQATTIGVSYGGTGVTTSTGSGSVVLSTSPSLTTPDLGTPSAVNLTNGSALPLTTGVSGILPTANGGTNLSTFNSGGAVYATSTSALTTGTLPITAGGTGQTTAQAAIDALLPSQTSNSGKFLTTNGTNASWGTVSGVSQAKATALAMIFGL